MRNSIKILVALMLVACMLVACGDEEKSGKSAKSYKKAADLVEDMYNGKLDSLEDLAPEAYWSYVEEECEDKDAEYDMDEIFECYEDWNEGYLESCEDEYGDDVKITLTIDDEEELDEDELEEAAEALEDAYDIDPDDIKEGYSLDVDLAIEGEDDDDKIGMEMYALKIDGSWYLVTAAEIDGDLSLTFICDMIINSYLAENGQFDPDDYDYGNAQEATYKYDF